MRRISSFGVHDYLGSTFANKAVVEGSLHHLSMTVFKSKDSTKFHVHVNTVTIDVKATAGAVESLDFSSCLLFFLLVTTGIAFSLISWFGINGYPVSSTRVRSLLS